MPFFEVFKNNVGLFALAERSELTGRRVAQAIYSNKDGRRHSRKSDRLAGEVVGAPRLSLGRFAHAQRPTGLRRLQGRRGGTRD